MPSTHRTAPPRRQRGQALIWLLGTMVLSGLVSAQPAPALKPVRYVYEVKGDLAAMTPWIELMHDLCKFQFKVQGKEVPPLELPSASTLANLVIEQQERLFDKGVEAHFEMRATVMADYQQNCKLRVARTYRAVAGQVCGMAWEGRAEAATQADGSGGQAPELEPLEDEAENFRAMGKTCGLMSREKRGPDAFEGVRQTATAVGLGCVWLDEALPGESAVRPGATRFCMLPGDPLQGRLRRFFGGQDHFKLKVDMPIEPEGLAMRTIAGGLNFYRGEVVAFEVGKPIPSYRFTRQAVKDFIHQPLWIDFGAARP